MLIIILAVFLLGTGFGIFVNSPKPAPVLVKSVEITSEATAAAKVIGAGIEKVVVKRVIDGDTIEIEGGRKVRYIGIDTPETVDPRKPVQCFGREAAAKNRELVLGKEVELEKDISETDKFGRLLRYVYIISAEKGRVMVNEDLVREGFAHASSYPPDVKYQSKFNETEKSAQAENLGLWVGCPLPGTTTRTEINASGETQLGPVITSPNSGCQIKGNISGSGKIYHLPGCGSYDKTAIDETSGERWFCTEDEAVKAGWRKAKNC